MRTKNAKRLWPVPATLAVMALAALLAFGLMATNGAQPAAAQDADCTFELANNGAIPTTDITCTAVGDTAVVEFKGHADHGEDVTLSVLIADKSGPISAYPQGTDWSSGNTQLEVGGEAASPAKYRYMPIEIPKAASNPTTGIVEGQSVTIMVKGDVRVWAGSVSVTSDIANIPDDNDLDGSRAVAAAGTAIDITFLGMPAIGKDADTDFNTTVDDDTTVQCMRTGDTRTPPRIVAEGADCATPADQDAINPNPDQDVIESRSKLVVVDSADTPVTRQILDGGELEIDMAATDSITIYALIEDEERNQLLDTDVNFTATTMPADIVAVSDLTDEEDTEAASSTLAGNVTGMEENDAVATFMLDDLADIEGSYRITIVLTVGDLELGTVVLKRQGDVEKIVAGVFNAACFTPGGTAEAPDYSTAKFNAKNKGCAAMGDVERFGAGEMIFVKAHLEDALNTIVTSETNLDSELATDDDLLGDDGNVITIDDPVMTGDPATAWMYMIDEDATLGDHMITVSTTVKGKDNADIPDVTLTVAVAGEPHMLELGGADNIPLNGSQTFTVTATDMLGGVPYITDMNNKVTISVQPTDALVVGTDTSNQVTLDEDTGMAEFTVYASLDADDGDAGRIIARSGDLEHILPITFGEAAEMPSDDLTPPMGIDVSKLLNTISVVWTPNTAQNATLIKVVLFNEDSTAIVAIKSYNPASSDPGAHDFENVAPGTYEVAVASYRPGERHELSDSHTVTIR